MKYQQTNNTTNIREYSSISKSYKWHTIFNHKNV
jgi:hypothetical protein